MTAHRKHTPKAPEVVVINQEVVKVTMPDFISNGRGGHYAVGDEITVSPAQAASLRLQGCAK